jgi:small nuclear ribonucleoprotein D3
MSIGVPIKLIHEAESHIITIEMKTGEVCIDQSLPPLNHHRHRRIQRSPVTGGKDCSIVVLTAQCLTRFSGTPFSQMYRGMLVEAEDNMNCSLSNVTMTGRDGAISTLEQVFVRGGLIRYFILPDILKNAPMFKRIDPKVGILRGKGVGIGRSTMARAKRGGPPEMSRGGGPGGGRGAR